MRTWIVKGKKTALFLILAVSIVLVLLVAGRWKVRYNPGELDALARDRTDKSSIAHGYTEIYEQFFLPLKYKRIRICEIGIERGGSLTVWRDYFPKAMIFGIDIFDYSKYAEKRIKTFVADQSKRSQLQSFIRASGGQFDVIIDDGGHTMNQQQISLGYLFKHVKPGGYYIVEDVHTSLPRYYHGFGVDKTGSNSTLTMINEFIADAEIRSKYMTAKEADYLKRNIKSCTLFFRNKEQHPITCIFKKKGGKVPIAKPEDDDGPAVPRDPDQSRKAVAAGIMILAPASRERP